MLFLIPLPFLLPSLLGGQALSHCSTVKSPTVHPQPDRQSFRATHRSKHTTNKDEEGAAAFGLKELIT